MTRHVVQFSGGIGSWATARYTRDTLMVEGDELVLLFADVLIEDEGTYEFLEAAAEDLGVPVTRICMGETPWEVFKRVGYLGNTRIDPCSMHLKREPLRAWIEEHCDPADTIVYLGIDWTEEHRYVKAVPRWAPWRVEAPLIGARWSKIYMQRLADAHALPRQRLYEMGMPHANCGGGCVKAGQGHFIRLLEAFPERFAEWEANEQDVISHIGKNVAILRDRSGGTVTPLPLSELRRRHEEKDQQLDLFDIGGCGCAID